MIPNLCADTSGNNFSFIEMGAISRVIFSNHVFHSYFATLATILSRGSSCA